jgi:hypothetical protein
MSETKRPKLRFQSFQECLCESPKEWVLENVIATNEDSTWYGPPGSGKSLLLTDIAVSLASGRDWRGYKFQRDDTYDTDNPDDEDNKYGNRHGVIYFALERADLTRRRVAAYAVRDKLPPDLPLAIVDGSIDLTSPDCVDIVTTIIEEIEQEVMRVHSIKLLIFDTWSKAIGNADENEPRTQNLVAANLRKIRERHVLDLHIAFIGHSGKDVSRGERGTNARTGHVDLAVQISGDTATIVKGNDQPEGPLTSFAIEPVTFHSKWSDGSERDEPITVGILSTKTPAAAPKSNSQLTTRQGLAMDDLKQALSEHGEKGAVAVAHWKEQMFRSGLLNRDAKNPREPYRQLRNDLVMLKRITEQDGFVRISHPLGNDQGGQPIIVPPPPS